MALIKEKLDAVKHSAAVGPAVCGTPRRCWEGCSSESERWRWRPAEPEWTRCGPRSPGPGPPPAALPGGRCCLPPPSGCSWVRSRPAGSQSPQASPGWRSACWGLEGREESHEEPSGCRKTSEHQISVIPHFSEIKFYEGTTTTIQQDLPVAAQTSKSNSMGRTLNKSYFSLLCWSPLPLVQLTASEPSPWTAKRSAVHDLVLKANAANHTKAWQRLWP